MKRHVLAIGLRIAMLIPLCWATQMMIDSIIQAMLIGFVASPMVGALADGLTGYYYAGR